MPESKDGKLGKFPQWLHDFFRIKKLYIETVMRFLYVLISIGCFCNGFFMLFGKSYSLFDGYHSTAIQGLLTMILGPVICRIVYEVLMMGILLVTNVLSIKNRLYGLSDKEMLVNANDIAERLASKAAKVAAGTLAAVEKSQAPTDKESGPDLPMDKYRGQGQGHQ